MIELIKGLVNVRDALTLIAFLGLIFLVAFRTNKVPELVFRLFRDRLTRKQFAKVLNRFMTLGFIAFTGLVLLAGFSQIIAHKTQPGVLTINDLRRELAKVDVPEEEKIRTEAQFNLAMNRLNELDLEGAIQSLQNSIQIIPTLTAREMLIYLYRQKRDFDKESETWAAAVTSARKNGDWLALARLDRMNVPRGLPDIKGEDDLIGDSIPLSVGGKNYETAPEISSGFYKCAKKEGCWNYYKLYLKAGQRLDIKFRSPPTGDLSGMVLYGTNGQRLKSAGDKPGTMRGNAGAPSTIYKLNWTAVSSGWYYLESNSDPGSVIRIQVH